MAEYLILPEATQIKYFYSPQTVSSELLLTDSLQWAN